MIKVLFVCHGNICRSAAAEMVLRQMAAEAGMETRVETGSAATTREEIGNDIYPPMKKALHAAGYFCHPHAARQTRREDYARWDFIIGMDEENMWDLRRIYDGDPEGKLSMLMDWAGKPGAEIDDPWYTRDFRGVLGQIEDGCKGLLKQLMREGSGVQRRKDRAVLFDLDGTLLNTLEDICNAMNTALQSMGIKPWETDAYRYMVGNGARVLAERAVRDRQELADRVLAAYQRQYEAHQMEKTRPYDGMMNTLRALRDQGVPLAVLSNKPDADTQRIIAHFFPDIPFEQVLGQRPDYPRKPDPTAALTLAEKMGIPAEAVWYVGDTSVDMECARRAGMRSVGVLWGFRTRTELEGSGAQFLIRRPAELVGLVLNGEKPAIVE